jgi:hypothetical protein
VKLITKRNGFTFCVRDARFYGYENAVNAGTFEVVLLVTDRGKVLRRHKFVKRSK